MAQLSRGSYTKTEATDLFVNVSGDTMTGNLNMDGNKVQLDSTSYLVKNGNLIELWVHNELAQSWEKDVLLTGTPIGLLLSLTRVP